MSDIDYVREGFARGWQGDGSMVDMDEAFADNEREFDRWLNEVKAEAFDHGYNAAWEVAEPYENPYRKETS